ncbi:MAG: peptidylprolyl isomerase [Thermoleophilia bacterium]
MRRTAMAVAAALAALALVAGLAACGGDDDAADVGAAATATSATAVAASGGGTVTNADGTTCSAQEPSPPADPKTYDAPPPMTIDPAKTYTATIATSCGDIVLRLDAKAAPHTVNNFVFLARQGFYDGLTFHRVVPGFVIQGGDPSGDGTGGPGYTFADELPDDGYPTGSLAMANSGPGTNGSQFFIVTGDASFLPNSYSRFGEVTKGLDVAKTIEHFADPDADPGDPASQVPTSTIWIDSVTIEES